MRIDQTQGTKERIPPKLPNKPFHLIAYRSR